MFDQIITWSNENDIVLDPFVGSGTTTKVAKLTNRHYIGFDISSEYIEIAKNRLMSDSLSFMQTDESARKLF